MEWVVIKIEYYLLYLHYLEFLFFITIIKINIDNRSSEKETESRASTIKPNSNRIINNEQVRKSDEVENRQRRPSNPFLRDLIRKLSNGIEQINYHGINIGVVDERGEIAAMYRGVPQNDIGIRTDVLDNVTKALGMTMLIRSMSPKVIVADEIGNKDEVEPIMQAVCSGIKGIFTAHGASIEDIKINPTIRELIDNGMFERIIFLSDKKEKGEIEKVYVLNKIEKQYALYNK